MFGHSPNPGEDIDTLNAKFYARDTLRDVYFPLAWKTFVVFFGISFVLRSIYALTIPIWVFAVLTMGLGILVGYVSYRIGTRNGAKYEEQRQSNRKIEKQRQLDEFMKEKSDFPKT